MTKQQLADHAGVSISTLRRWCKPYRQELNALGLRPHSHILPPKIVKFLIEKFCIDIS